MKKFILLCALGGLTFANAQETPKKSCCASKAKKECSTKDKKACAEKDKKACTTMRSGKKACCATKKAA